MNIGSYFMLQDLIIDLFKNHYVIFESLRIQDLLILKAYS
jgi:hypothetical protein